MTWWEAVVPVFVAAVAICVFVGRRSERANNPGVPAPGDERRQKTLVGGTNAYAVDHIGVGRLFSDACGPQVGVTFKQDGEDEVCFALSDAQAWLLTGALMRTVAPARFEEPA
jgi:hypothetical protein